MQKLYKLIFGIVITRNAMPPCYEPVPQCVLGWPRKMNVKKFCFSTPKVVPFIEKKNCAKYLFNMTRWPAMVIVVT